MDISPDTAELAFDHTNEGAAFEKFAQVALAQIIGPMFKPLGGHKDGGADGYIAEDVLEEQEKPTNSLQATTESEHETKIRRTIKRLKEFGRDVRTLYYATSKIVRYRDKISYQIGHDLDVNVRIYDRYYFFSHINYSPDVKTAYLTYIDKFLNPLRKTVAPSYPSSAPFETDTENARAVGAFLSQEIERKLGTRSTLSAVTDALILWALEGTDPGKRYSLMLMR